MTMKYTWENTSLDFGFSDTMVPILLSWTPSGLSIVEGGPLLMTKGRDCVVMNPPDIESAEGTLFHTPYKGYTKVKVMDQVNSDLRASDYIKLSIGHSGYIYLKPEQHIHVIVNEERKSIPVKDVKQGDIIPLIYIHECDNHIYFKSSNGDIWKFVHSSPIPKKVNSFIGKLIANRRIKKDMKNSGYMTGDKYYISDNRVTSIETVKGVLPQKQLPLRLIDTKPLDKDFAGTIWAGMCAPILVKISNYTNACVTLDVASLGADD